MYARKFGYRFTVSDGVVTQIPYSDAAIFSQRILKNSEHIQSENTLLKAQVQAQADRSEFIEDCIAEMAMQVYSNV